MKEYILYDSIYIKYKIRQKRICALTSWAGMHPDGSRGGYWLVEGTRVSAILAVFGSQSQYLDVWPENSMDCALMCTLQDVNHTSIKSYYNKKF